jgi:hypothetical protein
VLGVGFREIQPVDRCYRDSVGIPGYQSNFVSRANLALAHNCQIESTASAGQESLHHAVILKSYAELVTGHARLGNHAFCRSNREHIADVNSVFEHAVNSEIFSKNRQRQIPARKLFLPIIVMSNRIAINGFEFPAMNRQVRLAVSIQVELAQRNPAREGLLENPSLYHFVVPWDVSWKPDVDRNQLHHCVTRRDSRRRYQVAKNRNGRPRKYVDHKVTLLRMNRLTSFLLVLMASAPLFAKPQPVSVPFTTNADGMVVVPATLGGTIPMHVILDTGAGVDVIAPSLLEKVHAKPAGQFTGFRMSGERLDLSLFIVPELSVGPLKKKDALVGTWDLLDQLHLDGIISASDFRQQPFTLDFINKELVFETEKTLSKRRVLGVSSPLQLDDQRGITLDLFSRFRFGNQTGQCEIDTGSPKATISLRYMTALGIDKDGKDVKKQERRNAAGVSEVRYWTALAELSLSSAPQVNLSPARVSFSDTIYDCVVGVDFWTGRAVTFDIPSRQLIVSAAGIAAH